MSIRNRAGRFTVALILTAATLAPAYAAEVAVTGVSISARTGVPFGGLVATIPAAASDGNTQFVNRLYADLLGRAADADGLASLRGILAGGGSRGEAAAFLLGSTEYFGVIGRHHIQDLLGRAADAATLNPLITMLQGGAADEQVIAGIVSSPEYFGAKGGGSNSGFLNALYTDLLGRPIDPSGMSIFGRLLDAGTSRSQVATLILTSTEYRAGLIHNLYERFLHRPPTDAERDARHTALIAGTTRRQLIAQLISSQEYFNSAGAHGFTATIDWGDGTTSAGLVGPDPNGSGETNINGEHTFAVAGPFTVKITIVSDAGDMGMTTTGATVTDFPVRLDNNLILQICGAGLPRLMPLMLGAVGLIKLRRRRAR